MSGKRGTPPRRLRPGMRTEWYEVVGEPVDVEPGEGPEGDSRAGVSVRVRWADGGEAIRWWPADVAKTPIVPVLVE